MTTKFSLNDEHYKKIKYNSTQRVQTLPWPKCQQKWSIIQDLKLDFRINQDPDVCRTAPNMLWILGMLNDNGIIDYRNLFPYSFHLSTDVATARYQYWKCVHVNTALAAVNTKRPVCK